MVARAVAMESQMLLCFKAASVPRGTEISRDKTIEKAANLNVAGIRIITLSNTG